MDILSNMDIRETTGVPNMHNTNIALAQCHDYLNDTAVALRADVRIEICQDGVNVTNATQSLRLRNMNHGVRDVLGSISSGPVLLRSIRDSLDPTGYAQLGFITRQLGCALTMCVLNGKDELIRIERIAGSGNYAVPSLDEASVCRLSEFTFVTRRGDGLVLESPLARHRVTLVGAVTWSLPGQLSTWRTVADTALGDTPQPIVRSILAHLAGAGLVDVDGQGGISADPSQEVALRQWEFHDLLLHSRSRHGRYDGPMGGVYPFLGEIDPQPAVKPPPDGPRITLHRPQWADIQARDPSFTTVLEGRASVRHHGVRALTADELGEFLYRVARVRAKHDLGQGAMYEMASRPWPCGGGVYELELYLTIDRCTGLDAGIYYYDPVAHQLILINESAADRDSLFGVAQASAGGIPRPQVLVTITSRFQRLSWKYRAIAYSITLRDVGVLYQTMYLVATAMSLAPCGLGSDNAVLAERVLGLDYLRESSVGDFILGSSPARSGDGPFAEPWQGVNDPEWAAYADAALSARLLNLVDGRCSRACTGGATC
jgi:SagB-type dehydrogenase family enzyme